jgi:mono/diheme cytochrome c family protein
MRNSFYFFIFLMLSILSGCFGGGDSNQAAAPTARAPKNITDPLLAKVVAIMDGRCISCHPGTGAQTLDFTTNAEFINTGRAVAGNLATSTLYTKVTTPLSGQLMPIGSSALSAADKQAIADWINSLPAANVAPVLTAIGDKAITNGALLTFVIAATDANGDTLTFSAPSLPAGAIFVAGTQTFSWSPGSNGVFPATFRVDDDGTPTLNDLETINITVTAAPVNNAPTISLSPVGNQTFIAGESSTITLSATDPNGGDVITFTTDGTVGTGDPYITTNVAVFNAGAKTFVWQPKEQELDVGGIDETYTVEFTATDDGAPNLDDNVQVTYTVTKPTYTNAVQAIIASRCAGCHPGGGGTPNLHTFVDLTTNSSGSGPLVVAGSPATSRVVIRTNANTMPPGSPKLTAEEKEVLRIWILEGATN